MTILERLAEIERLAKELQAELDYKDPIIKFGGYKLDEDNPESFDEIWP